MNRRHLEEVSEFTQIYASQEKVTGSSFVRRQHFFDELAAKHNRQAGLKHVAALWRNVGEIWEAPGFGP